MCIPQLDWTLRIPSFYAVNSKYQLILRFITYKNADPSLRAVEDSEEWSKQSEVPRLINGEYMWCKMSGSLMIGTQLFKC